MEKRLIPFAYKLLTLLVFPLLALFLLLRADLRKNLWRRFFPSAPQIKRQFIWFHAASAGEARQAVALACKVRDRQPDIPLLITCNTSSGLAEARRNSVFDATLLFPFDMPFALRRIFRLFNPRLLLLIESEYWPGLLRMAAKYKTPTLIANARLSESTSRFFDTLNTLSGGAVKDAVYAAADETEGANLSQAGIPSDKIKVCGNIKIDMFLADFKAGTGTPDTKRQTLLAASTHSGEELILLEAFARIRKSRPGLQLLLAPRHIVRAAGVLKLAQTSGFSSAYCSSPEAAEADTVIINEFGNMAFYMARADAVFIGGSLVRRGGHNPLEAILAGKPLMHGPHILRWRRWTEMLHDCGAAGLVNNAREIEITVADFLDNWSEKSDSVKRAWKMLDNHRGALSRNSELIFQMLEKERALGG